MGAKACRGIIGDNRENWQANRLLWDCKAKKDLVLCAGENVHREWEDVEDCVSGVKGTLTLTTLRLIWQAYPNENSSYQPNISAGLKLTTSVQFNAADSRHYGRCRTLAISTRYCNVTYEFSFALSPDQINDAFHTCESWQKRFKASRIFRETLVREMKMTKNRSGAILYHPEQLIQEIPRVENIAASKKYGGRAILTTHRFIWVSSRSSIVNLSIPFMELRMITTRRTPFGLGLVLCGGNVSISHKPSHLREYMRPDEDSIVAGFLFPSLVQVQETLRYCQERIKVFQEEPFYMPVDGRVSHRMGRWMTIDEETWREEMGLNEVTDEESSDPPPPTFLTTSDIPVGVTGLTPEEVAPEEEEVEGRLYDDPLTPCAQPVAYFDLGSDADVLTDIATVEHQASPGVTNPLPEGSIAATATATPIHPHLPETKSPAAAAYRQDPLCVICLNHNPQLAFDPCGHMCTCKKCGTELKECPMCRQEIIKTLKVFIVN